MDEGVWGFKVLADEDGDCKFRRGACARSVTAGRVFASFQKSDFFLTMNQDIMALCRSRVWVGVCG
jgi:hypothetical protein